jgi:hypothetical protein
MATNINIFARYLILYKYILLQCKYEMSSEEKKQWALSTRTEKHGNGYRKIRHQ